ncbi:transposase [Halobacteriales archaeon QS_4_69_34]|nr:MAG: transposase [Halobacteriales archaeon QS_4_69_34]
MSGDEYRSDLVEQAEEEIDANTEWPELAEALNVEEYAYHDEYEKPTATPLPFAPMFLAILWAYVEERAVSTVGDYLEDHPKLAAAFGFDPDAIPSNSTFYRAAKYRFEGLDATLSRGAKQIRQIAAAQGSPIGYAIGNTATGGDGSKRSDPSERTIDRLFRRESSKVLEELRSVVYQALSLPRPGDPQYDLDELLDLEAVAAIKDEAANGAGKSLGDMLNPDPDMDADPYYFDGPSGETLLKAIKQLSVDEIADMMNVALKKTYTRAKPRLRELEDFDTFVSLAIDITYVAYRGETEGLVWLQGTPDSKDYKWCHKFATAAIVGENTHFIVGVMPLGSTEHAETDAYPGADKSYRPGNVVRTLVGIAEQFVNIRMIYADREFPGADSIAALNEKRNAKYVMPVPDNDRTKRLLDRIPDDEVYVRHDYPIHGVVRGGTVQTRVTTILVVLPPDDDDSVHEGSKQQVFYTNTEVDDEIGLDRRETKRKIERYRDRAAIETSYEKVKEAAAWTTSKEFEVRWYHFAFGCAVYNLWLLVDFLAQERIGVIEVRQKPRIHLSRFLDMLKRKLVKLI